MASVETSGARLATRLVCLVAALTALLLLAPVAGAGAAIIPVENTDDAGPDSLRQAIIDANADTDLDGLDATGVSGTIGLQSGLPTLTEDVEIRGPGAGTLTVRRGAGVMSAFRIFTVDPGVAATISGLTLASGNVAGMSTGGAGINNAGTLTLRDSVVTGNVNTAGGGGADGGGILNTGTLTVLRSAVNGNSAARGAGIRNGNDGELTVRSSTVSGNTVTTPVSGGEAGGGILNRDGTVTVVNSTVSGNDGGTGRGGGLINSSLAMSDTSIMAVRNSTIADNTGSPANLINQSNFAGAATLTVRSSIVGEPQGSGNENCGSAGAAQITSQGYNLADDASCNLTATADRPSTNPMLGPLANNGGPTRTMAVPLASPAVDKGISGGLTTDQRGLTRPVDFLTIPNAPGGDGTDIGALEVQEPPVPPQPPPVPPQPPSNQFDFGKVKKNKKRGTAKVTVELPGPGDVALDGKKVKPVKVDVEAGAAGASPGGIELKLKVKAKGKGKRKLKRTGKAKVRMDVTYTPDGGEPNTKSRKLKLKKRR